MGFFYLYYALGLPTFLSIIIALYLLFTGANSSCYDPFLLLFLTGTLCVCAGSGEAFNVGQFLEESSPYLWASTGIGLCIGFSVLGAGWCEHHIPSLLCAARFCSLVLTSVSLGASSSLARQSSAAVSGLPAYEPRISSGLHRYVPFLETRPAKLPAYSIIFCEVVAIYGVVRLPPSIPQLSRACFSHRLSDYRNRILGKACPH